MIVCSIQDALQAERGGATRLEIVRDLASGGFTPPLSVVKEILGAVKIPVRVMLREQDGFGIGKSDDLDKLCAQARQLAALAVDGLVLGFIGDGNVDLPSIRTVLGCAPCFRATFHHAFEETVSPQQTILKLKEVPQIDRILTHGGSGSWPARIRRLGEYQSQAQPEIQILAGGGLNLERVHSIRRQTQIREFHVGSAVRMPQHSSGSVVDARVREFSALLGSTAELTAR
ncbi:MAG: copper homeostasis protein CutC [Bryobacteraceae bacterium]